MPKRSANAERILATLRQYNIVVNDGDPLGPHVMAWDRLSEPVQDMLLQMSIRLYDCGKFYCTACGCGAKERHIGAGCPVVPNTQVLDGQRVIDLCCGRARAEKQVEMRVTRALATGASPLVPAGGNQSLGYVRPHYDPPPRKKSIKSKPASKEAHPSLVVVPPPVQKAQAQSAPPPAVVTALPADIASQAAAQVAAHLGPALREAHDNTKNDIKALMDAVRFLHDNMERTQKELDRTRQENVALRQHTAEAIELAKASDATARSIVAASLSTDLGFALDDGAPSASKRPAALPLKPLYPQVDGTGMRNRSMREQPSLLAL